MEKTGIGREMEKLGVLKVVVIRVQMIGQECYVALAH
jgi:hypothetical protein